ncbi:MAG: peptidoglycan DD-metalloendopeptidase family protein [Minisyncoccia bacterium]
MPKRAGAFWPFSSFTDPVQADTSSPLRPDDSLKLLAAATNVDPNPIKGAADISLTEGSALIAETGPNGTPYLEGAHSSGRITLYVVREGDTLSEIADMFGVSSNTVLWANNLASAKDIHPGNSLVILPVSGIQHTVKKGETLVSLAKTYGGDAEDIASYNALNSSASLSVGTKIIIPGGELAITKPATKSGAGSSGVKQGGGLSNILKNPYRGGSGATLLGFFGNPVPSALVTQSIHGWNGVDLAAKTGTPMYAAADGTIIVSRTGGWNGGYGNYVVIDHANGTQTLYAHMSRVVASAGTAVSKGQLIGYVGATGEATGSHLHFEVRGAKNPFASCRVGYTCTPQ